MSISKCIVRLKDCHETEHSVEVYAESLYEAVLRGLNRLADVGWESTANETVKRVEVEIHQEPTRHIVRFLLNPLQQLRDIDVPSPGNQKSKAAEITQHAAGLGEPSKLIDGLQL